VACVAAAGIAVGVSGCGDTVQPTAEQQPAHASADAGSDATAGAEPHAEPDADADAGAGASAAADLATCLESATPAATPYDDGFPRAWPFPPRTVVFGVEDRGSAGTVVTAVSATAFDSILTFLNDDVARAGFAVERGETEEHDAEADWRGQGFRGRWAIRESAQCPGQTVIQVLSTATG